VFVLFLGEGPDRLGLPCDVVTSTRVSGIVEKPVMGEDVGMVCLFTLSPGR